MNGSRTKYQYITHPNVFPVMAAKRKGFKLPRLPCLRADLMSLTGAANIMVAMIPPRVGQT